jgi:cytochrome c-type biogenesis protein CcmH
VRRAALPALISLALLAAAPVQAAVAPKASQTEIEGEVMCPVCGTLLELSDSPQAQRERSYINTLIAQGRTKQQIEDALVEQYGPNVLATPSGHGFDLTAWIVPALGLVALAAVLGFAWWRRGRPGSTGDEQPPGPLSPEDAARLDRDISRYEI